MNSRRFKLGILASHPIQYQAPLHAYLAALPDFDVEVMFCNDYGTRRQPSAWGVSDFQWDIPLLDGYKHIFLPNAAPINRRNELALNLSLPMVLRDRAFDAVLQYGYNTPTYLLGILSARVLGIPLIMRCDSYLIAARSELRLGVKSILVPRLLAGFSAYLAVGVANRAYYKQYGVPDARIFNAPHSVNNDWWIAHAASMQHSRDTLRMAMGLPTDAVVFGYVGQMLRLKRVDDIIVAFAAVAAIHPKAHLLLVGSGPELARLRALAKDIPRVIFAGFKNQTELPAMYTVTDVLVLASETETWGLVANEAMCFGNALLLSAAVGCAADLVADCGSGMMFPVGDTQALSGCMTNLLDDDRRLRARAAARARVHDYSFAQVAYGLRQAVAYLRDRNKPA